MKNFIKKRGVVAAAAVLLAVAAIFVTITCNNDIDTTNSDDFTIPTGKGAVKLSFDETIARTILPNDVTAVSQFSYFDFSFTAITGGTGTSKTEYAIPYGSITNSIALDPGDYNLTVIAYYNVNGVAPGTSYNTTDFKPMAKNNPVVPVTITAAQTTSANIVLKPYDQVTGTGDGIFRYKITSDIATGNLTSASMTFTLINTGVAQTPIDLITTSVWNKATTTDSSLQAGDYYVDFLIKVPTGEEINFRHIVHIYQFMTSSYEFIINRDYFNALFTLIAGDMTYENSDHLPLLKFGDYNLSNGDTVALKQGTKKTITVTNQADFSSNSIKWYNQSDTALTNPAPDYEFEFDASSTGAFNAKRTYLLTIAGENKTDHKTYYAYINIKVVDSANYIKLEYEVYTGSPTSSANTWNEGDAAVSLDLSTSQLMDINVGGTFDSIQWYIGAPTTATAVTGGTFTLSSSTAAISTGGNYKIIVVGTKDGVKTYTNIDINVTAP